MMVRKVLLGSLGCLGLLLVGCGGGDPAVEETGILHVTRGGAGSIFFASTQTRLSFGDSVTVAVQSANDRSDQFTIYTLFGLSELNLREVPVAALVAFVSGLRPTESASTEVPSSVLSVALHSGFDRSLVFGAGGSQRPLAQNAPVIYEQTSAGTFILEAQSLLDGTFPSQTSSNRQVRWSTLTLTDLDTGAEALIDASVIYQLSRDISQQFFSYLGNLGLDVRPSTSGGGPPPPPGTTGGGGTGGSGSGDVPPAPPL